MTGETDEELSPIPAAPPKLTLADLRGLTPADLRDLSELRREYAALQHAQSRLAEEHAALEVENQFLRQQLTVSLAGWRDEQRRARALTEAPPPAISPEETDPHKTGAWAHLWGWLTD